ncbi:MAG TPA: AAA family ATPase [Polyangiaceae bacterium]
MRIAISGSHRTGKSTLLAALAERLPRYENVDEPYHLMEEDGHEFSHPPSLDDFVAQLERSLVEMSRGSGDVLFDRSPLDFLAYIQTHEEADSFDTDAWLPGIRDAVESLDFVVFVPLEVRDRIRFSASDDETGTRAAVDVALRELLVDDSLELGVEVLEVDGDVESRVRQVLRRIDDAR